jgi:nicotinamidase-related amidase
MKPEQIGLILIDIQKDFWQPLSKYEELASFPANVESLLQEARDRGVTVFHVQSVFKPDRSDWMLFYRPEERGVIPCIEGTGGTDFEDFATPLKDEVVIQKQTFDAFMNPFLEDLLKKNNVKAVFIAGLETSVCVLFTSTSMYQRGILPIVVSDACADEPTRHETVLKMYNNLCFKTVEIMEIKSNWSSIMKTIEQFSSE